MAPVATARAPRTAPVDGPDRRARSLVRRGVFGATLILLSFGLLNAFAITPFYPGDETAHTDYALEVSEGDLPVFDDRFPDRIPGMSDQWPTMAAAHPPLYYLLAAVPLRLGVELGAPLGGFRAARLLSLLIAVAVVVLTARLAGALVPPSFQRPRVAVAAAALVAAIPSFQQVAAFVYNDALAIATAALALLAITLAVRYGATPGRTALLVVAAVLAASARTSGVTLAALAVLAAASPPAQQRGRPLRERLAPALGRMAVVGGTVAAVIGWFYLRNLRLYGDPAATDKATAPGVTGPPVLDNLLSPSFWAGEWLQLWGYLAGMDEVRGAAAGLAFGVLATVLAGLAWLAGHGAVRLRTRSPAARPDAEPAAAAGAGSARRLALAWLFMGLHAAVVTVTVLDFFAKGAIPFGRYFFPLLPLLGVLGGVALAALPGARRGAAALPTLAVLVASAATGVLMAGQVLATMAERAGMATPPGLLDRLTGALAAGGLPAPGLALAGLAAMWLAGVVLVTTALLQRPSGDRLA